VNKDIEIAILQGPQGEGTARR